MTPRDDDGVSCITVVIIIIYTVLYIMPTLPTADISNDETLIILITTIGLRYNNILL